MQFCNTQSSYGLISIIIHWLTAVTVFGMFALGLWMVDLTYYDEWYRSAPLVHKGVGVMLLLVTLFRLLWRRLNISPAPVAEHKPVERTLAKIAHIMLYILLFSLMLTGYLISTADGRALEVFNWFSIPATISGIEHQEDIAGDIHELLAFTLIAFVLLHAAGAIKHHVFDKDNTLKRMLGL